MQPSGSSIPGRPDDSLSGQVVSGRYRLLDVLGRGGMGRVYRAEHVDLGRNVAVKVLEPVIDLPHAADRFAREARATASLRHPNIVDVIDFGEMADGSPFLVMEFLDGEDLGAITTRSGPMGWPQAHGYVRQICSGLSKAHAAGLVHRDLKLENIMVVREDDRDVCKILDFGIAKSMKPDATRLTNVGSVMGTPEYMSPEQARGRDVDHRTDIYAVGVICYELLTGVPPFSGESHMGILMQHINDPVPPPSARNPSIPPSVDAMLLRALDKDKTQRFGSMEEFIAQLDAIDGTQFGPTPSAPLPLVDGLSGRGLGKLGAGAPDDVADLVSGPIGAPYSGDVIGSTNDLQSGPQVVPAYARAPPPRRRVKQATGLAWLIGATVAAMVCVAAAVGYTVVTRTNVDTDADDSILKGRSEEGGAPAVTPPEDDASAADTAPPASTNGGADDVEATVTAEPDDTEPGAREIPGAGSETRTSDKRQAKGPSADEVNAALEEIRPGTQSCTRSFVGGTAGQKIRLRLEIDAGTGKVRSAKPIQRHRQTRVGRCVAGWAKKARFAPFGKGTSFVNATFVL